MEAYKAADFVGGLVIAVDLKQSYIQRTHLKLFHIAVEQQEHKLKMLRHNDLHKRKRKYFIMSLKILNFVDVLLLDFIFTSSTNSFSVFCAVITLISLWVKCCDTCFSNSLQITPGLI